MKQKVAVGTRFMQEVNVAAILAHLRAEPRMSVSTLAAQTGLSRQAVARSLALLESDGYVEISEPEHSAARSGRPPQMVRFRSELGYVVGVDVSPHAVRIVIANLVGDFVADARTTIDREHGDTVSDRIRIAIDEALTAAKVVPAQVWHVSASAPGIVDPATGKVTLMPSMADATGSLIIDALHSVFDCPVYLDNDVKLATQGERWRADPRDEHALVFIDWGERVGAGIVLGGELYRGASNDAGDIGYLDLLAPSTGDHGRDSALGPFERWVGIGEILTIAARHTDAPNTLEWSDFVDAVHDDAPWATSAVETIARRFSKGIAAIRSLLDPETVVIGGDIAELGDAILSALVRASADEPLRQPRLELSRLGAEAIVQGAIHNSLMTVQRTRFPTASHRD